MTRIAKIQRGALFALVVVAGCIGTASEDGAFTEGGATLADAGDEGEGSNSEVSLAETEDAAQTQQALTASCTRTGCNGKDPMTAGCNSDAITKAWKYIYDDYEVTKRLGKVEMRYSAFCQAQWGRVANYNFAPFAKIALRSADGSVTYSAPVLLQGATVWSKMRYSPYAKLRADGAVDPGCQECDGWWGYSWVLW